MLSNSERWGLSHDDHHVTRLYIIKKNERLCALIKSLLKFFLMYTNLYTHFLNVLIDNIFKNFTLYNPYNMSLT